MNDKETFWKDVLENIKISVSSAIFKTWFSQTHLVSYSEGKERVSIEVGCVTSYVKSTIESRYFGLVLEAIEKSLAKKCDLVFVVKQKPREEKEEAFENSPLFGQVKNSNKDALASLIRNSHINPRFSFENYAVSSSNQMAHAAAEAVANSPGDAYNPLFIWGGVGVGKTHLMNAVGLSIINRDDNSKALFCTGEDFTNDIVEGIRNKSTQTVRNKYRKLDCLLIDDIQFIAGKDTVQEEFFHTFNAVASSRGQIILTSDRPPSEIPKLEERLRSRFEAGLIVDISNPDFELRCAILQIKAKERGINLEMDQVQLISANLDSARKIAGFLVRLASEVSIKRVEVSEDLIKSILGKAEKTNGDLLKSKPTDVIEAVSKYYSVGKRSLMGASRARSIARPRQVLMYILRTQLGLPLEEVGRLIGGRDHTTVMHAVNKVTELASSDVGIREDLLGIKKAI